MDISLKELALIAVIASTFLIGLFVLWHQPKRFVNRAFFTVTTGISMWGFGLILLAETGIFYAFDKLTLYGFVVMLVGYIIFAEIFPRKNSVPKDFYLLFIPLAFIAVILPFNLVIKNVIVTADKAVQPINGPLFPVFAAVCTAYVFLGLFLFIRTYKNAQGQDRRHLNYLLLGLGIFIICAITFDVILPAFQIFGLNFLGPISSIFLTGFSAYAIIRHRLMDIRIVIQRGLIYTILLAIIIVTYIAGIQLLGHFLDEVTNSGAIVSAGATMVLGIFFLRPLENYFQKITDHIFFKDSYDYAEALHSLSRITFTSLSEKDILEGTRTLLQKTFKTDDVAFLLDPKAAATMSQAEQSAGFETLTCPIRFDDNAVGILRLGKKRSGDIYTKQDLQLVSTFALQIAISLGKAKLHARVQEYSTHLEELVEERTAKIKHLQEEQKEAMIDISHNLQTPLAVIRGELELLGENADESSNIHVVNKSIDRISGFIRQLLRIARFEHMVDTVEMTEISLSTLLREQADYFEVVAEDKGVRIKTEIEGGISINGNKRLLEELFTNLVANAITYKSPLHKALVHISLQKKEGGAVVTIRDNGIGIAPEDLVHIFDRFYRTAHGENTPAGTGLGLAIAKEITEKHSGTIKATSVLGEGTTFVLSFPAR